MMAKLMKIHELHYPMIQVLIMNLISYFSKEDYSIIILAFSLMCTYTGYPNFWLNLVMDQQIFSLV